MIRTYDFYKPLFALVFLVFASCGSMKNTEEDLVADARDARAELTQRSTNVGQMFNNAHGYAIFPNVGKGAYVIGGASGNGVVYEQGQLVGYADLKQLDVGLQIGGKAFVEVLFFQTKEAMDRFKEGTYELAADASAVVVDKGFSRDVDFREGVAVITMPKAGAMAGISVGGQRFGFTAVNR